MKDTDSKLHERCYTSPFYEEYLLKLVEYNKTGEGTTLEKLEAFAKYVPKTSLAKFLAKYELFKKILDIQGVIVECGVYCGGGLMSWAQLSSILEPMNHQRRIIGFDTFTGFPEITKEDIVEDSPLNIKEGMMSSRAVEDIRKGIEIYDLGRFMNHIPKVSIVVGDIKETAPKYIEDNSHLIISLLYIDTDLHAPAIAALRNFRSRMPKGAIVAFDEANVPFWPGETQALEDYFGIKNYKINRNLFGTALSYIILD